MKTAWLPRPFGMHWCWYETVMCVIAAPSLVLLVMIAGEFLMKLMVAL